MAKSNWQNSAGWGAIDDPTGVLNGRVLVISSGISQVSEDYLLQIVGTSSTFDKDHYSTKLDYAWPSSTSVHPFGSGTLGLVARASTLSGAPVTAQNCYIGEIDIDESKARIVRRYKGSDTTLAEATLESSASSRGVSHTLEFKVYGTSSVTLQLILDGTIITNVGDSDANRQLSGYPGIKASSGTVYGDNFVVMQYTADGNAPEDWTPNQLTGLTVAAWYKSDTGTTATTTLLSAWADQSVNSNNMAQSASANQPTVALTQVNGYPAIQFDGTTSFMDGSHSTTMNMATDGVSIFVVQAPTKFNALGIAKGGIYGKIDTYEVSTKDDINYEFFNATDQFISAAGVGLTSTFQIVGWVTDKDHDLDGHGGIFVDGTNQYTATATTYETGANNSSGLLMGKNNAGQFYAGSIAEIVVIKGELSTGQRQQVEGYLAQKYATWPLLPNDHPYKYAKPTI